MALQFRSEAEVSCRISVRCEMAQPYLATLRLGAQNQVVTSLLSGELILSQALRAHMHNGIGERPEIRNCVLQ